MDCIYAILVQTWLNSLKSPGLPGQDFKEIEESIQFVANQRVKIYLEEYSPIPGTPDFLKSGLKPDKDPLFHNNSAFPLYRPDDYQKFHQFKDLVHKLNTDVICS